MFAIHEAGEATFQEPLSALDEATAQTWRERWDAIANNTDDTTAHEAFIDACAAASLLEYAGACYRMLSDRQPLENEQIAGYRSRVLKAAMARHGGLESVGRRTDRERLRVLVLLTIAAIIVAIFAAGYYFMSRYQTHLQHG